MHNPKGGIIVSSGDLALQGITRHQAGNYTCIASNVEGDGESNTVELRVMCKFRNKSSIYEDRKKKLDRLICESSKSNEFSISP